MDPQPTQQVQVTRVPGTGSTPTPPAPKLISKSRFILALTIAVISDALSVWTEFVLPVQWVVDGVTALLLFLLLGRRWQILPGLVAEAIPGLAVLPFWVVVVLAIFAGQVKARKHAAQAPTSA